MVRKIRPCSSQAVPYINHQPSYPALSVLSHAHHRVSHTLSQVIMCMSFSEFPENITELASMYFCRLHDNYINVSSECPAPTPHQWMMLCYVCTSRLVVRSLAQTRRQCGAR